MNGAGLAAFWSSAAPVAAAAVAFIAAALALRPRGKPAGPYLLVAAAVFWLVFSADLAPLAYAARGADPDAALPVTLAGYAAAAAVAVAALMRGHGRAVLCAAAAIVIRWIIWWVLYAVR